LPVEGFPANGELCLNRLCQARGQAHSDMKAKEARTGSSLLQSVPGSPVPGYSRILWLHLKEVDRCTET
jgi:hypothetical protein